MSAPKYPNHPCHWWPDLTPEDATEDEIELVHRIAGDSSNLRGMTWKQYRGNLRVCAADIRRLAPPSVKIGDGKDGVSLIAAERDRQVSVEGWTLAHDDEHFDRAMVEAAICYAQAAQFIGAGVMRAIRDTPDCWPWDHEWWKPSENPIRNLVKAGALIGAEIDRLIRAQADAGREEK